MTAGAVLRRSGLLLGVALLLVACGGDSSTVSWRDLDLTLPDGWEAKQQSETLLYLADGDVGDEGDPGDLVVAAQFTHQPGATADDWRDFVEQEDATLETDTTIDLDDVPATQLVFSFTTNGVPTREMVVVVPSRDIVGLLQPVPVRGQTDAPEVFLERVDEFEAILDSIRFGAPVDFLDTEG